MKKVIGLNSYILVFISLIFVGCVGSSVENDIKYFHGDKDFISVDGEGRFKLWVYSNVEELSLLNCRLILNKSVYPMTIAQVNITEGYVIFSCSIDLDLLTSVREYHFFYGTDSSSASTDIYSIPRREFLDDEEFLLPTVPVKN